MRDDCEFVKALRFLGVEPPTGPNTSRDAARIDMEDRSSTSLMPAASKTTKVLNRASLGPSSQGYPPVLVAGTAPAPPLPRGARGSTYIDDAQRMASNASSGRAAGGRVRELPPRCSTCKGRPCFAAATSSSRQVPKPVLVQWRPVGPLGSWPSPVFCPSVIPLSQATQREVVPRERPALSTTS